GPGYPLTPKPARRRDDAGARIYRTGRVAWDGSFDMVVLDPPARRAERNKLAANLSFLGYGPIEPATWVAARPNDEVAALLAESGIPYERFTAIHTGGLTGASALVRRAWDLHEIGAAYQRFVRDARSV